MHEHLDLEWRVGDLIAHVQEHGNYRSREIQSIAADGLVIARGKNGPRYDDFATVSIPLKDRRLWQFTCHNAGAPFEKLTLHEDESYEDARERGLYFGIERGQYYRAGGPMTCSDLRSTGGCRHQQQNCEFQTKNHAAHQRGWAQGQKEAHIMATKSERTIYQLLGRNDDPIMTFERAVQIARSSKMPLLKVEQCATGEGGKWETTNISGPIELPPETKIEFQPVLANLNGSISNERYLSPRSSHVGQYLKITREGGKIIAVELVELADTSGKSGC